MGVQAVSLQTHSIADDSPSTQLVPETYEGEQPTAIWSGGNRVLVGATGSDLSGYFEVVKALRLATQLFSLLERLLHSGTGEWRRRVGALEELDRFQARVDRLPHENSCIPSLNLSVNGY